MKKAMQVILISLVALIALNRTSEGLVAAGHYNVGKDKSRSPRKSSVSVFSLSFLYWGDGVLSLGQVGGNLGLKWVLFEVNGALFETLCKYRRNFLM